MDLSKLDELIKKPKKGDQSHVIKEEYSKEIQQLLREEKISGNSVKYLVDGFTFLGALPLFEFLRNETNENTSHMYFELKEKNLLVLSKTNALKFLLELLALFINEKPENREIIADIISISPEFVENKDGSIRSDLKKVIEKYLLLILDKDTVLPDISELRVKDENLERFRKMIYNGLENYRPEKKEIINNMAKLYKWLELDVIGQNSVKAVTPEKCPGSEPAANKKNMQDELKGKTDLLNEKSEKVDGEIPEWKKNLQAVEKICSEFEKKIEFLNRRMADLNVENRELKRQKEADRKVLDNRNAENEEFKKANERFRSEVEELKKAKAEIENELLNTKQELDGRVELSGMLEGDYRKKQEAFLNRLANEIRFEYEDFQNALNLEMTVDLGENMRLQLLNLFEILSKSGVNF